MLESPAFANLEGQDLHAKAEAALRRINGALSVANSGYEPIELSGVYSSDTGDSMIVAETATAVARAGLTAEAVVNDAAVDVSRAEPDPLRAARINDDYARALDVMATRPLGWGELWKVYEIIRESTSAGTFGRNAITSNGWATASELDDFAVSANDPAKSGDDARHAKTYTNGKGNAITLTQGRDLMSRVLAQWAATIV